MRQDQQITLVANVPNPQAGPTCLMCSRPAQHDLQPGPLPDHCVNGERFGFCYVSQVAWARVPTSTDSAHRPTPQPAPGPAPG